MAEKPEFTPKQMRAILIAASPIATIQTIQRSRRIMKKVLKVLEQRIDDGGLPTRDLIAAAKTLSSLEQDFNSNGKSLGEMLNEQQITARAVQALDEAETLRKEAERHAKLETQPTTEARPGESLPNGTAARPLLVEGPDDRSQGD